MISANETVVQNLKTVRAELLKNREILDRAIRDLDSLTTQYTAVMPSSPTSTAPAVSSVIDLTEAASVTAATNTSRANREPVEAPTARAR